MLSLLQLLAMLCIFIFVLTSASVSSAAVKSVLSLSVASCKSIGGNADPGASFMLGDLSEPCYSSQHIMFILVLGVPMFILWVVGIPLFAWAILYRNRALIQAPATGTSDITRAQKKNFESQIAFLYRGYKPTRYYWFLNEMFRKAALVAISVFFPGALHTQLLLASLLIFVCILLQIFGQPFENRVPGAVEFLSLGTSFMIFFLANFLFVDTLSHSAKVVATVLICVLVILFFVVVVIAFIVLQREEMSLAPLRVRLREAYILGHDVPQIMRKWRQNQLREKKLALDRRNVASTQAVIAEADFMSAKSDAQRVSDARRRHAVQVAPGRTAAAERGHDGLLVMETGAMPAWNSTFDQVAIQTTENAKFRVAARGHDASAEDFGNADAATAAEEAIAGAEARQRLREQHNDPTLVVNLDVGARNLMYMHM